jgi:CubicO group peptidase (beta-lactamase class C family)
MSSAGFGAPGTPGKLDEPLGHNEDGSPRELGPGDDNPPAIGPGGTVHATLADWAKFVAAHLKRDTKLLKPETYAKLHEPAEGDGKEYAMGWGVAERDWGGGRVLTHSGSNTMWYCVVWMAPKKDFAVLVAANQGKDKAAKACDEAASAMIRALLAPAKPAGKPEGR